MRMTPVYNNVMRMLGSIQVGTYLDGKNLVRVMQDTELTAPDSPAARGLDVEEYTLHYVEIPKKEILFRDPWGEVTYHHLITECALPDWFWKNKGCVELQLDHLKRVRW